MSENECRCCGIDLIDDEAVDGACLPCSEGDCPTCAPPAPYQNAEGNLLWHAHPGTSAVPNVPTSECIGCIMERGRDV